MLTATYEICARKRSTRSNVARAAIEYTSRKPSPSRIH
jgi:hypothetical protein